MQLKPLVNRVQRSSGSGGHPGCPPDLDQRKLPLRNTKQLWTRIYLLSKTPLLFGRSGCYRFDDPMGKYGVLYVGQDEHCAFVETFGHETGARFVTVSELTKSGLCCIEFHRALRLVDLTAEGLAKLGADERLCSGDVEIAREWSYGFYHHHQSPDGILYRARHDPSRVCAALFDRVKNGATCHPKGRLWDSSNRAMIAEVLNTYGFGLIED